MVLSDNRLTCAIALAIFAIGIAVSVLLIAAYSRPFTGEISVGPQLLQQVIATEPPDSAGPRQGSGTIVIAGLTRQFISLAFIVAKQHGCPATSSRPGRRSRTRVSGHDEVWGLCCAPPWRGVNYSPTR